MKVPRAAGFFRTGVLIPVPHFVAAALIAVPLAMGSALAADCAIVAHRGASHDAPENTVTSARLAWEQDADAVELDIHLTKDGRLAVLHDADTKRTTGAPGKVVDLSWEEVRKLDAGAWKDARWKGERIPQLEEILATVPPGKRLFIEIKSGPEILPELERVLQTSASRLKPEHTVLIGFDYDTMVAARKRFPPTIAVHWLSSFRRDARTGAVTPTVETLIARAKAGGLTGLDVNYQGPVNEAFVRAVKGAGLQCHVWTVDDPVVARRLRAAGVESITTNRPRWLREQLARP
jgi:glycerophosphoryl diester phosphodiesterase